MSDVRPIKQPRVRFSSRLCESVVLVIFERDRRFQALAAGANSSVEEASLAVVMAGDDPPVVR